MSVSDTPSEQKDIDNIHFHFEEVDFSLPRIHSLKQWIESVATKEKCRVTLLNFVFCTDPYLHQINLDYLNHDTLTDIITFPYTLPPDIEGDIFISIDRVKENAIIFKTSFLNELHRVISHGVLHLCGYHDKSPEEKKLMTQKENEALQLLEHLFSLKKN